MGNMILGVELLVIGMGTVVLSLYLLSVFLHFSGKFFGPELAMNISVPKSTAGEDIRLDNEKNIMKAEKQTETAEKISPKKIAAVSAAVHEMLSDKKNYRIISIKKSNNNWKR